MRLALLPGGNDLLTPQAISNRSISLCGVLHAEPSDFEAQDDGVVAKILQKEGQEVKVGSPIMVRQQPRRLARSGHLLHQH